MLELFETGIEAKIKVDNVKSPIQSLTDESTDQLISLRFVSSAIDAVTSKQHQPPATYAEVPPNNQAVRLGQSRLGNEVFEH